MQGPASHLGGNPREAATTWSPPIPTGREVPRRHDQVLRGPGEIPHDHAQRQAGVLLTAAGEELPRRHGAAAGAALDREGRIPRRTALQRAGQEVPAAGHLQPSALARTRAARRHHLAPRDRDLQGHRSGRLPLPPGLAPPADAEKRGIKRRRRGQDLSTSAGRCSAAPTSPSASCRGWSTSTTAPSTTPSCPGSSTGAAPSTPSCPHNITSKNAPAWSTSGFLVEVETTDLDELQASIPRPSARPFNPVRVRP